MKLVAFAIQDAIKALTSYGWNGRVTTNNKMDGWLGLPYYDVPHLVHAFEANPSVFTARKSAPKRASTAVKDATLPPPPPALPHDARHPRPIKSAVVLKKRHVVGIVGTRRSTLRSGVQNGVHKA